MTTHHLSPLLSVLGVMVCLPLLAQGRGADWPRDATVASENIGFISVGAAFDHTDREMRLNDGELVMLHSRSVYGMASCDLVSWLTLTAGGGQSQVKPEDFDPYGDNKAMWMAGAKWTIWDFPLSEPPWLMSLFRVETSVSYWQNKAVLMDQDMDWHEWRGTLTVSAERYVEEWGKDSTVIPYSLLFYAGCAYSQVGGDVHLSPAAATAAGTDKMGFDEEDSFAVIGGIDFFISHNLSIGAEARAFDGTRNYAYTGSMALHF